MGKPPKWHRPKLTETQLGGEDNRLIPRRLLPDQVRADLIRALASMDGAATVTAAYHELGIALKLDSTTIANCLSGLQPIYGSILDALYGPGRGSSLPIAWTTPTDFGPLIGHAVKAGLVDAAIERAAGDTPEPTNSPDPGAGAPNSTVAAPASEIVALASHPPAPGNDLPAVAATTVPAPAPELDQSAGIAAPPAFSSEPVSLRASDAASPAMGHRSVEPVQLRPEALVLPAASEGAPLAPNPPDPLAVAELLLAGRLNAAIEEAAAAQRRYQVAELRARNLRTAVAELRAARADFAEDRAAA